MNRVIGCGALLGVGLALAGCSQITVTSNTLVDGASRIADASTAAVRQTSDATTDATNKTFAKNDAARRKFVDSQYAMLKSEAARGQGEDLDALAAMMSQQDKSAFATTLQSHYGVLFAGKPTASVFLTRLYDVVGVPANELAAPEQSLAAS